jgi:tRNA1(Val) A37 N6-methylase TrmN6
MSAGAGSAAARTDNAFLGGALSILQPRDGYRAGLDAVLLAAAVPAGGRILDLGAGVGTVGLCAARRLPSVRVTLVERDAELAGLAEENARRNGLADRVAVIVADVAAPLTQAPELAPLSGTFEHVVANPPYNADDDGTLASDAAKAAAHSMPAGALDRWLRAAAAMARAGGTMTLVHRADALGDVLAAFEGRFGGVIIFPLFPRPGVSASRILVQGVKGSRARPVLRPGLVLHGAGNAFTEAADSVLRYGQGLQLAG